MALVVSMGRSANKVAKRPGAELPRGDLTRNYFYKRPMTQHARIFVGK